MRKSVLMILVPLAVMVGVVGVAAAEGKEKDKPVQRDDYQQVCTALGGVFEGEDNGQVEQWTCTFHDPGSTSTHECWSEYGEGGTVVNQSCDMYSSHDAPAPDAPNGPDRPSEEAPDQDDATDDPDVPDAPDAPDTPSGPGSQAPVHDEATNDDDAPSGPTGPAGPSGPAQEVPDQDEATPDSDGASSSGRSVPKPHQPASQIPNQSGAAA